MRGDKIGLVGKVLLGAGLSLGISTMNGCVNNPPYQTTTRTTTSQEEHSDLGPWTLQGGHSGFGPWTLEREHVYREQFSIQNFYTEIIDSKKMKVSGIVTNCSYELVQDEIRTKTIQVPFMGDKVIKDFRSKPVQIIKLMPEKITVSNVDVPLNSTGSFDVIVEAGENFFFMEPPRHQNKYYSIYTYKDPSHIYIKPTKGLITYLREGYGRQDVEFPEFRSPPLQTWRYDINYSKLEDYVKNYIENIKNKIVPIEIEVCDQITHLPVSPTIKVKGLQVPAITMDKIKSDFVREFGEDGVIKIAISRIPKNLFEKEVNYIEGGEIVTENGQNINFRGILGGLYEIETTHNEYYYFRGNIKAEAPPKNKKKILLVERGSKVRMENVKEGEGGQIIDGN